MTYVQPSGGSQMEENSRKGPHNAVCTIESTAALLSVGGLTLNSKPKTKVLTGSDSRPGVTLASGWCTWRIASNSLKTELILEPQPTKGR